MKLVFSSIKNQDIFEPEFQNMCDGKNTVEFKGKQGSGGIAVVYAPNGTGKSSLSRVLAAPTATADLHFQAADEDGNELKPESGAFHVIQDQIERNIIHGEDKDYLIGSQIEREYKLRDKINAAFARAFESLAVKYKSEYKVSKVGDFLLAQIDKVDDPLHKDAYRYIRKVVNAKQRGKDIKQAEFVAFLRKNQTPLPVALPDPVQTGFVIDSLSRSKIIESLLAVDAGKIQPDTEAGYIEQHDDAIGILNKYTDHKYCVVCDNQNYDGKKLLGDKQENRKRIYEKLDKKTKQILDVVIGDDMLSAVDPFAIKRTVRELITDGNIAGFAALQQTLKAYVQNLGNEMIDHLLHCFDGTTLFRDFDEHARLVRKQPKLDTEELLFIQDVISENIGKDITIIRDKNNDNNFKLKIGEKDLLQTDRRDMELSNGEQNFISLAFELLLARNSEKPYVVIDDPISSFDSVYKNKIAFCIIKFLEKKRQIILTHNTDLIRLLNVQNNNCFHLYILNNTESGNNGFIPVSEKERQLLINLHDLVKLFQNRKDEKENDVLLSAVCDCRQFLMAMVPFMRGYAHITLDPHDYYGTLSQIMHGYEKKEVDVAAIYQGLFGYTFPDPSDPEKPRQEIISAQDILALDYTKLNILDHQQYPLLADTLEQTLIYYHLRMKVEKELMDIFGISAAKDEILMLSQIIMKAFDPQKCPLPKQMQQKYRVFFTSRKTLLNEFNHFEGNMNIFQPAIDIEKNALIKEAKDIEQTLRVIRDVVDAKKKKESKEAAAAEA